MAKDKITYTVVVDQELDIIFGFMMQAAADHPKFFPTLKHNDLHERFLAFSKETAEKNHKMGWCLDPDCTHKDEVEE